MKSEGMKLKFSLMKLDILMDDIVRIYETTPSEYVSGKKILAEARCLVRTNIKKSLRLAKKAKSEFDKEAVLAVRYNRMKDKIDETDGNLSTMNADYKRCLTNGDFAMATEFLEKMIAYVPRYSKDDYQLEIASTGDSSTTLSIKNNTNHMVSVESITVSSNGNPVETDCKTPFALRSNATIEFSVPCGGMGLAVIVNVRDSDGNRELSVRGE